jgi:MoaA/NifB/PqqE/SkfB family radical SAM enzyme
MGEAPAAARLATAIAHHRAGRLAEAQSLYAALTVELPHDASIRHNLGMVRLGLGNFKGALALLEEAHAADPDSPAWTESCRLIAGTLFEQRHWEHARPWLERLLERAPQDAQARNTLERIAPRDYLAPEVFDAAQGRVLKRNAPRESATYLYAIDIVGTCNLRCPTCPVGNFAASDRPKGFMAPELFGRILAKIRADAVTSRPEVWLFNWGEPLLHPKLPEMIALLRGAGLPAHLSTNLNVEHGIAELAKAKPDSIKISLSGFTQATYAQTHVRGDLNLVKANMHLLRHYLDKYRATTRVWVGHHLYKINQDQVGAVRALCDELGFEHHPVAAFYQPIERLVDLLEGRSQGAPIMQDMLEHPLVYLKRIKQHRSGDFDCELRFNQTVINHDGTVALCCSVYDQAQMLGVNFLDLPHREIEARKYGHPFCATCMGHGLEYAVSELPGNT